MIKNYYTVIWEHESYTTDENGDENWVGNFPQKPFKVEAENLTEAIIIANRIVRELTPADPRNVSPTFGWVREIIDENGVHYSEKGQVIEQLDQKTKERTKEVPEKIDEILEREGYKKFLVKVRVNQPTYSGIEEKWVIIIAKKPPSVGEKTEQSIGTFCIEIPAGEIIQVEPYSFASAQEYGVIDRYCLQCRQPITPWNIFGLTDVFGWGGRHYCSEKCFRLNQEV